MPFKKIINEVSPIQNTEQLEEAIDRLTSMESESFICKHGRFAGYKISINETDYLIEFQFTCDTVTNNHTFFMNSAPISGTYDSTLNITTYQQVLTLEQIEQRPLFQMFKENGTLMYTLILDKSFVNFDSYTKPEMDARFALKGETSLETAICFAGYNVNYTLDESQNIQSYEIEISFAGNSTLLIFSRDNTILSGIYSPVTNLTYYYDSLTPEQIKGVGVSYLLVTNIQGGRRYYELQLNEANIGYPSDLVTPEEKSALSKLVDYLNSNGGNFPTT